MTGTTPPPVDCPNSLCNGKPDGNYGYMDPKTNIINRSYFVQCTGGEYAYCQSCFPMYLQFSETCNQCLYNHDDECVTTKSWAPATTYHCPDMCPSKGANWSGNMADQDEEHQYIACWNGMTVGCIACPPGLMFNEKENACLWDGKWITKPMGQ